MARPLTPAMQSGLTSSVVRLAFLVSLQFTDNVLNAWTGKGPLIYNGVTYTGVGSYGSIGALTEGIEVMATGTTLTLSAIDKTILNECMNELDMGAPATIYLALLDAKNTVIGNPAVYFGGVLDKASLAISGDKASITLSLETNMTNLQRGQQRRYTRADQALTHPDDSAFSWVEVLNDVVLRFGH